MRRGGSGQLYQEASFYSHFRYIENRAPLLWQRPRDDVTVQPPTVINMSVAAVPKSNLSFNKVRRINNTRNAFDECGSG